MLSNDALETVVTQITRTATIQGAVKEDYIASEMLSRV